MNTKNQLVSRDGLRGASNRYSLALGTVRHVVSRLDSMPPSPVPRRGMTLIELMVVVVILVTLVAGVLPLISPNNDARKIREASRGLKTFMMAAQAEAARTGRPVGVGFRESSPDSGVAIEVFQLAVPPEYPGSSPQSRVGITKLAGEFYPNVQGAKAQFSRTPGVKFNAEYHGTDFAGAQLYGVKSYLATSTTRDPLPPGMFRVGDVFKVDQMRFKIVDDLRNKETAVNLQDPNSTRFIDTTAAIDDTLICVWLDEVEMGLSSAPPLTNPPAGYRYRIERQPAGGATANPFTASSQPAYQLPAGIGIDLNASGFERGGEMFFFKNPTGLNNPLLVSTGILFSPSGDIESVWLGGYQINDADRVFFLVGRGENGSFPSERVDYTSNTSWYVAGNESDDELSDLRTKINWLNPESRWLMIERTGTRLQVVENAVYDPRATDVQADISAQRDRGKLKAYQAKAVQIEHAHELAHGHGGGGR